jgi:hypothetical protein
MTRVECSLFIPEETMPNLPATSSPKRTVDELMAALCIAWGTLSRDECQEMEKVDARRQVLARVRAQEENNATFMAIRRTFGIPDHVKVHDFPAWLADALKRQRTMWEAEMRRGKIGAPDPATKDWEEDQREQIAARIETVRAAQPKLLILVDEKTEEKPKPKRRTWRERLIGK